MDDYKKLTPLEKARVAAKALRELGITPERLDPIAKAAANPKSLRAAVNAKCWDCVGAGADPNPRRLIRECLAGKACPLWSVRPYINRMKNKSIDSDPKILDGIARTEVIDDSDN